MCSIQKSEKIGRNENLVAMVSLKGGQNGKQYNLKYILLIPHKYGIFNYIEITHATRLTLILNSDHHFQTCCHGNSYSETNTYWTVLLPS
jgi:hypothetical protein